MEQIKTDIGKYCNLIVKTIWQWKAAKKWK